MYAVCSTHPIYLLNDHSNYNWRRSQVMKLLILLLSPIPTASTYLGQNNLLSVPLTPSACEECCRLGNVASWL
jgi:hypothetical protein